MIRRAAGSSLSRWCAVPLAGGLQVVDRVEIDVGPAADGRIEVARHGQVEHQQRPLAAAPPRSAESRPGVTIGSPAAVVLITRSAAARASGSSSQGRASAAPLPGQLAGPLEMPVDHGDPPRALVAEVTQRFLGHLARADHQRLLVVESLEDLPGEVGHGHAGNAHAALVDGRFGGHAAGDADGRLKGRVQQRPGVVVLDGRLVRLLHLGENLRLAHHHAVQAGGHGEQVPHRLLADVVIQVRRDLGRIELVEAGQEAGHLLAAGRPRPPRRPRRPPPGCTSTAAPPPSLRNTRRQWSRASPVCSGPKRQPLADGDRRAVMAATDDLDVHNKAEGGRRKGEGGAGG